MNPTIPFGDSGTAYVPAAFEPEIRNRILAGKTVADIAEDLGADRTRLHNFVSKRIRRWRAEGRPRPATADDTASSRRLTVYQPFVTKSGGVAIKPIRLPYVTMHARALEERHRHV
ncbi:hypothetical protein [Mycoplana ramosa]|uniref:Uncharacterized protein n=1 Tax=Mycoplana ramosa TaxID=40837 RepID=A0ABW3YWG8_MYCRA